MKSEIKIAEHAGFCSGVKRALQIAVESLAQEAPIYIEGQLVHNPDVTKYLEERGLYQSDCLKLPEGSRVLLKSHGTTAQKEEFYQSRNYRIIDATCPYVKRIHKIAEEAAENNYSLLIFGESSHPEVVAIADRGGENVAVISSFEQLLEVYNAVKPAYLVSQTTANRQEWERLVELCSGRFENLKIFPTICPATEIRQNASLDLASKVDIIIIVGGYNSSNTRRLHEMCSQTGVRAYHIENAEDLDFSWFNKTDRVGITAGASTPDWVIKEVKLQMDKSFEQEIQEVKDENVVEEVVEEVVEAAAETVEETPTQEAVEAEETAEAEEVAEVVVEAEAETEDVSEEQDDFEDDESEESEEPVEEAPTNMEDILDEDFATLRKGSIITGTVIRVTDDEVLVDIGYKTEGVIVLRELTNDKSLTPADIVKEGDTLDVYVLRVSDENGNPILSKRRAESIMAWKQVKEMQENNETVTGQVIEAIKGGLLVDVLGLRAFLPASLVDRNYVADLNVFIGEEIQAKVIEIDRRKRRVVLSRQAYVNEIYQQQKEETWARLEEGAIIEGTVQRITKFGAFIDIGAVDGLAHISELSWGRVNHPSEVLKEGDKVQVKVLSIDKEKERISLSLRQVEADPWTKVAQNYQPGEIVEGTVVRTVTFGAFVELEPGVEGLVHISQLAWNHVEKSEDVVKPGDVINVKVLSVNEDERRISLSLKETTERPPRPERPEHKPSERRRPTTGHSENASITLGDMFGDLLSKAKQRKENAVEAPEPEVVEETVEVPGEEVSEEQPE